MSEEFGTVQTLGRAVRKVARVLPTSPRKKKAVLTHLVANMNESDKSILVNVVSNSKFKRGAAKPHLITSIRKFYERDDISRASPKTDDVKTYECPETGEKLYLPTRHMLLSLREAYALFVEESNKKDIGRQSL